MEGLQNERFSKSVTLRICFKDCEARYNTANGWKGPAPSQEEHNRVDLYKVLGTEGVDFTAFFAVLREGNYDGWIMLDYTAEVYAAFNSPAGAQPLIPASDPGRVCHHENR